jgi:hypothetical protein
MGLHDQPSDYICHPCGIKYGTPRGFYSTYHTSECGWCGERTSVTHCRAYNYPIRPEGLRALAADEGGE